jgi:spore germination protein KB
MVKNIKISARQFFVLVAFYSIGTSILIIPGPLAEMVKQDAWIAGIAGVGISLLLVWLYSSLGSRLPELTLVEMCEKILGKWLGKAVSATFVFFALIEAAELLYFLGDFLTTQIMPRTPPEAINILVFTVVILAVRLGLEPLARTAEIFSLFCRTVFDFDHFDFAPDEISESASRLHRYGIQEDGACFAVFHKYFFHDNRHTDDGLSRLGSSVEAGEEGFLYWTLDRRACVNSHDRADDNGARSRSCGETSFSQLRLGQED